VPRRLSPASTRAGTADLRHSNTAAPKCCQRFAGSEPHSVDPTWTVDAASPGSHPSPAAMRPSNGSYPGGSLAETAQDQTVMVERPMEDPPKPGPPLKA
jgi:hypothetical protein